MNTTYKKPSESDFEAAVSRSQEEINGYDADINTETGSVVHELVIRPASVLMAWIDRTLSTFVSDTSVATLSQSQSTDNELADLVASNYFVTRRDAAYAKGVVTITATVPVLRIQQGTLFSIGGNSFVTDSSVLVSYIDQEESDTDTVYVKSVLVNGVYKANVPVVSKEAGKLELPAGSLVVMRAAVAGVTGAELLSPVSGGSNVETDAEMFQRIRYFTSSADIGSSNAIARKLQDAPVYVKDMYVAAHDSDSLVRGRYNNTLINTGGVVDVYVKTQDQPAVKTVYTTAEKDASGKYKALLSGQDAAGVYCVTAVTAEGSEIQEFSFNFGSGSTYEPASGTRLSSRQTVEIEFSSSASASAVQAAVTVMYMPGVYELQQFMDSSTNKFIGTDILIKAAVPVTLLMTCAVKTDAFISDDYLSEIKDSLASFICGTSIGTGILNFSDIQAKFKNAYPEMELRLPCTMSASRLMYDGSMNAFFSNTGVLTVPDTAEEDAWSPEICFFSATPDNMGVSVL